MRIGVLICAAAIICSACAAEAEASRPPAPRATNTATQCTAGTMQSCTCGAATGMQSCSPVGAWSACECASAPTDFDNADPNVPVFDAGGVPPGQALDCSPGLYLGTYECEISIFGVLPVPLAGDVSFNLSIDETTVDRECRPGQEFCSDLVISENGGTLFGLAGLFGFETMLEGALDCTTGEFRATGIGGRWGNAISMDVNDPNALWTVEDPPLGRFNGELQGMYTKSPAETIAGDWNLQEPDMGITCAGPFTVTLQP